MNNPESENFDDEYFELLSEYGKSVFNEFLSDLSRQRQNNLLASALITILLSLSIVGNVETEIFGLKFTFNDIKIIPIVARAVCTYFFTIYLVGVFQDWQLAIYSSMPTRIDISNLSNHIALAKLKRVHESAELSKNLNENRIKNEVARAEIFREIDEMEKRHQIEKAEAEKDGPVFGSIGLGLGHSEEERKLIEKLVDIGKDGETQNTFNKIRAHLNDASLEGKARLLDETSKKYLMLNKLNIIIQVIFPSLLALFAIGSAIWKVVH